MTRTSDHKKVVFGLRSRYIATREQISEFNLPKVQLGLIIYRVRLKKRTKQIQNGFYLGIFTHYV